MPVLSGPRAEARSGETKSLVVLLHGYGADGNDLFGLHQALAEYMPDTVFVAPDAPEHCPVNPMGHQWFPIPWIDGSTEETMRSGFLKSAETLDTYLTEIMAEEGVTEEQTVLIGFSQGTMMSLSVGPRRDRQFAGIVGFSGRLIDESLGLAQSRPPILLIHGDQDEVIQVAALDEAAKALQALGFEVYAHVSQGTGHGIAPDGLGLALGFICDKLGIELNMGAG
ncbi:MAG: dienelactone hydrolase family protein [Pseudomonadota bacterium]